MLMHVAAPMNKAIEELNTKFTKANPDIDVEVALVPTAQITNARNTRLAAKDVDIVEVSSFLGGDVPGYATKAAANPWGTTIRAGNFVDLTDQPFVKRFYPNTLEYTATVDGKIWSVPTGSVFLTGVYYNKSIFASHNLAVPTTWPEFVAVCETLRAAGLAPITIGGKDGWPADMPGNAMIHALNPDLKLLDEKLWTGAAKLTDRHLVEVLVRTKQYYDFTEKNFMGIAYATAPARFASGAVAMMVDGSYTAPTIDQAKPAFEYGYFPLPGSDNAADNTEFGGRPDISFAVAAASPNVEAAQRWLDFYSMPDNYGPVVQATGFLPAQDGITTTPFADTIAARAATMKMAWTSVFHPRQDAGKFAGFPFHGIAPRGAYTDMSALAAQAQTDWDAAG